MEPQLKVVEQTSRKPSSKPKKTSFLPFLVVISVIIIGVFAFQKSPKTVEDDVIDEFVSKTNLKNEVYKNLDVYGSLHALKVVVPGSTNVYGSLTAKNSDFKDINVYGSVNFVETNTQDMNIYGGAQIEKFKGRDIEVYGKLAMTDAVLSGDLFVAGPSRITNTAIQSFETMGTELILDNVSVKKLKISNPEKKKVILHLRQTKIESISFEGLKGDIIFYGDKNSIQSMKEGVIIKKPVEQFPELVPLKKK